MRFVFGIGVVAMHVSTRYLCFLIGFLLFAHSTSLKKSIESTSNCIAESPLITSLSFVYPKDQELLTVPSVQPQLSSVAHSYEEAVARNHELSLTYSMYLRQAEEEEGDDENVGGGSDGGKSGGGVWRKYEESTNLQVFGTNVFRTQFGENQLIASIYHQNTLICEAVVVFHCCERNESELHVDSNGRLIVSDEEEEQFISGLLQSMETYVVDMAGIEQQQMEARRSSPLLPGDALKDALRRNVLQITSEEQKTLLVLVAIKSFALNAHIRQAIRNTYFTFLQTFHNESLLGWKIEFVPYFVIGKSLFLTMAGQVYDQHIPAFEQALLTEQRLFGDVLLEDEVPFVDTYFTLTEKVLHFFHWVDDHVQEVVEEQLEAHEEATTTSSSGRSKSRSQRKASMEQTLKTAWHKIVTIVTDDDTYLNIPEIAHFLAQKMHNLSMVDLPTDQELNWYGGEVLATRLKHQYKPIRHPDNLHYLQKEYFPFEELPPFALGNCYFLSGGLGRYIAKNYDTLKPVGTLEDLSVGFWMLSLRVQAQHFNGICELQRCIVDNKLFQKEAIEGVDNIRNRIFAIAKLQVNTSFYMLHDAFIGQVLAGEQRDKLVLHGQHRRFSKAEEDGNVLQLFYMLIFQTLQEIEDWQSNVYGKIKRANPINRLMLNNYSTKQQQAMHETNLKRRQYNAFVDQLFAASSLHSLLSSEAMDSNAATAEQTSLIVEQPRVLVILDDTLAEQGDEVLTIIVKIIEKYEQSLDIEFLLSSLVWTTSPVFTKLVNLHLPMRYFDLLHHAKWKEIEASKMATPSMTILMRYLYSFDHIVRLVPVTLSSIENTTAIHTFLTHFPKIVPSISKYLPRPLRVDSIPSFALSALMQSQMERRKDCNLRFGKLSEGHLQRSNTLAVITSVFIFTSGSLYAKSFLEETMKQHFPSHFKVTLYLSLVRDVSGQMMLKHVDGQLLTANDWQIIATASSYIFATSFLDCSMEKASAAGPRLVFALSSTEHSMSSAECLQQHFNQVVRLLAEGLQQDRLTAEDIMYRMRSMFFAGEVFVDIVEGKEIDHTKQVLDNLASQLHWLNAVFICNTFEGVSPLSLLKAFAQGLESTWKDSKFKVFYLPIFANQFYESRNEEEGNATLAIRSLDLLLPRSSPNMAILDKTPLRIAYLYYRCDRVEREQLFAMLSSLPNVVVDALGRCPHHTNTSEHQQSRFQTNYNIDAIARYRQYDMVIAGENSFVDYYITEKLLNAYLANAVPIYIGSNTALKHFQRTSMVYCDPNNLQLCVQEVADIAEDRVKLNKYRQAALFNGKTLSEQTQNWLEMFYWHESAHDTLVYHQFQRLFRFIFYGLVV